MNACLYVRKHSSNEVDEVIRFSDIPTAVSCGKPLRNWILIRNNCWVNCHQSCSFSHVAMGKLKNLNCGLIVNMVKKSYTHREITL